jgi:prolyl-tRNA editing enzyme YbaK/EbsC (Cys-tRNA(Pro) deacylase)
VAELPEPVERVAAFLRTAGAEARLEEFLEGTPTARDAARAIGCGLDQIVKSLVFECDGRPVVVLVPGNRRADPGKVAACADAREAAIASRRAVEEATGFEPGAVAPFPLPGVCSWSARCSPMTASGSAPARRGIWPGSRRRS